MIQVARKYPYRLTNLFLQKAAEISEVTITSIEYSWRSEHAENDDQLGRITVRLDPDVEWSHIVDFSKTFSPYEACLGVTVGHDFSDNPSFTIGSLVLLPGHSKGDFADHILVDFYTRLFLGEYSTSLHKAASEVFMALHMQQWEMLECINEHGNALPPHQTIPPNPPEILG